MEKQVVVIDVGNGNVQYIVGEVQTKSEEKLSSEIAELEEEIIALQNQPTEEEIIKKYDDLILELTEKRDAELESARHNSFNLKLREKEEELENLKAVHDLLFLQKNASGTQVSEIEEVETHENN